MPDTWMVAVGLIAVVALIAINGLFVAAEFALVGVRRTRIEQLAAGGQSRARTLLATLQHLDRSIAATQLGITMAGLAIGWLGEPFLARLIDPPVVLLLSFAPESVTRVVTVVAAFSVVTALVIVFGELAPKAIALHAPEAVALWVARPLRAFGTIFRPIVWALNSAGFAVVRPFGIHGAGGANSSLDPEELEIVIEASARAGLLSTSELLLARRALEFSAIQSDQIMVPRTEVVAIHADAPLDEVLATVARNQHARYPVVEADLDHILGILDVKDLIALLHAGGTDWRPLVRPAVAIPEAVSVEVAVASMRARHVQIVILIDEHGGTSGILTADEVLYRLLGRWLGGGGRADGESVRPLAAGNFLVSGLALIADVEDATSAELAAEDYDTVGGFVMARLGRIPRIGDRVQVAGYEFRVTAMDGRRVDRVLLVKTPASTQTATDN